MQAHCVDVQDVHGKLNPADRTGCGVVIAVAAQHGNPSLGHELQRRGVKPGSCAGCIPRAERGSASAMPDADEQQVAVADVHLLRLLGSDEVVGRDVLAGLEPRPPGQPRHVEQDASTDDAVTGHIDGQLRRPDAEMLSAATPL